MARLDQSNWVTVANNSGPYPELLTQYFDLLVPCDRLLITVDSNNVNSAWIRAGYAHYNWVWNEEPFQLSSALVYLKTSVMMTVEPLGEAVISFEPVTWVKDWTITIKARLVE